MNKRTGLFVLLLLIAVVCTSCMGKKSNGVMNFGNRPEIVTYKTAASGGDIPDWVLDASDGNSKAVKEAFNLEGKRVWILQNDIATSSSDDGNDLYPGIEDTFYDVRSEVYSDIYRTSLYNIYSEDIFIEPSEDSFKNMFLAEMSYSLRGIEFTDDFWVKTRTLKDGLKKAKSDDDYSYSYIYLCVFAMDEDIFQQQVSEMMTDMPFGL